jgi:hypothetical protein
MVVDEQFAARTDVDRVGGARGCRERRGENGRNGQEVQDGDSHGWDLFDGSGGGFIDLFSNADQLTGNC